MVKKQIERPVIELKEFRTAEEIDLAIRKIERRIAELESLDLNAAVLNHSGADDVAVSNVRDTIRDVFGLTSPEYDEHGQITIWAGPMFMGMTPRDILEAKEKGRRQTIGILKGLIGRLSEKRSDLLDHLAPASPSSYLDKLNIHPRLLEVARELFMDGYHWEAVFAASKALVNYVKERAGKHDLDGTPLMRSVFSKQNPILAFNDLKLQTDLDEQEGMMHLFEGAVLGIRNPGGHSFPEGSEQRAIEYLSLLSLLAYRTQEARRRQGGPDPNC